MALMMPRIRHGNAGDGGSLGMTRHRDHGWRPADHLEIPPSGDVVLREPREGWSPAAYAAAVQHYFLVPGAYPRTARMHPSTAIAVAPADRVTPLGWPVYEVRRH